ncbi:hypothetical protein [Aliiroseovarius marinus]|uniref:hypothetical protein n=1 Tax=Aliiroseovarius marinus TaxID=2500159 RepID=UPI00249445D0|nr:hypothetical protein [Aliiroseovarius marinus]
MTAYIPIARRFSLAEKQELRDPDYLSYFGSEPEGVYRWPDLFEMTPVVVLGEGRSGKTREFEMQVEILRKSGSFAFFLPLERLHDEDIESALSSDDLKAFEAWKVNPTAIAHFFLDALDELKLREGSLRAAVRKLQSACKPHLARAKLVVSCRPADWQSQIDTQHLEPFCVTHISTKSATRRLVPSETEQRCGPSKVTHSRNVLTRVCNYFKRIVAPSGSDQVAKEDHGSKDFFLKIISKSEAVQGQPASPQKVDNEKADNAPTIVTLLPLSRNEIREFARNYSPDHSDAFCAHLETHDFWHIYRLPAEIIDALDQMATNVPLGTLEDQLELSIQRKLREQQPNKPRALSVEKARQGAERIALALFLLKRRTVKIEDNNDPDSLNIGDILTDWTTDEQKELIGKTLFDPSGVGSVRFHHRATQEYLAAKRLNHLRAGGMHERDMFALLFSEIGGKEVVKPSMAPVAAWLALWHADIRRILLELEPGLLFRQGLPSALSMDIRAQVLRAYVPQYARKGWCSAGIGHEELRRVAHSELGSLVRELWDDAYTGHDSRELLLEMILLAPMPDCTDLALEAALDDDLEPYHRIYASRGVLAAGTSDQKLVLAEAVLDKNLPQRVIRNILPEMVPSLISTDAFLTLVEGMDALAKSVHGLNYTIYLTVKNEELSSEERSTLRDRLAEAIWLTRRADCQMFQANSEKDHYQDGLIACCNATIPSEGEDPSAWAWALAVAVHFGERHESIIAKKETEAIWSALECSSRLREAYFWACLEFSDELEKHEDDWSRFIRSVSESRRSIRFVDEDQVWLLNSVVSETPENRRGIAFQAIIYFFDLQQSTKLADELAKRVSDRADWSEYLHKIRNPKPRQPDEWEVQNERRSAEQKAKEEKRVADWLQWRTEVLNTPNHLMDGDGRLGVLYDAKKVISQGVDRDCSWGHWDSAIIAQTLGEKFLERYRQELSVFWRETEVLLRSERAVEVRNSYPGSWLLALTAVKAEAETIGWAKSLSHDEAIKAARIACIELNGFGGFVAALDEAHPKAVSDVIADEACAELDQLPQLGQAEMFHDILYHGTGNMKAAVAERIAPRLSEFVLLEGNGAKNAFEYVVRVIADVGSTNARALATELLEQQLERRGNLPVEFALSLLATLDPEAGCRRLLRETEELNTVEARENAARAFASLFGDRYFSTTPDLGIIPEGRRVFLLGDLVQRAYQAVRRDEDIEHEGTYTPDLRDHAQHARSFLLESLLNIKLPETLAVIHELAEQPEFDHMSDRLRQMAYEIAAQMSDMTAHPLIAFQALDRNGAFIPFDHRSLLTAMMTRLDSFEHDILYAEDSPIDALRKLELETELRRSIAFWLRRGERGVFEFTQEAVVVDENRTDIRFHPRSMQGYATVELKRQTWSVRELERALTDQLVGQYLQHDNCRVGCLLICQARVKRWRHPDTNAGMSLKDVVDHLNAVAREIMAARPELHIAVKGIDYSGP